MEAAASVHAAGVTGILQLDDASLSAIFCFLSPRQACTASLTCKAFRDTGSNPALWKAFLDKDFKHVQGVLPPLEAHIKAQEHPPVAAAPDADGSPGPAVGPPLPLSPAASGAQRVDFKAAVRQALAVRDLRAASWAQVQPTAEPGRPRVVPCAREGHAAASWGNDSMILFGGWGSGIRNDLYILDRQGESFTWRVPAVAGVKPVIRYGHSVTRCGGNWDQLLVFGGMQSGGYMGEITEVAVLRPRQGSSSSSSSAAAATPASASLEWFHPDLKGPDPQARGYHAAAASLDGRLVYVFGGIQQHDCCNTLAVINVETWEVELPQTHGAAPKPRFGCSLGVWGGGLWVVGGGHGNDLARSGYDLEDVHRLDLATLTWSQPALRNKPRRTQALGRCHAFCQVGSKLVLFGGSLELGNDLTWLDLERGVWGVPSVLGPAPGRRMSAVMAPGGRTAELVVFGGWIYASGEMGDLWRVKLDPPEAELAQLRRRASQLKERGGQSGQGGRGQGEDATRGPVCPRARFWRDGGGEEGGASGCNISAGPSTSLLGGARGQSRSGSGSGAGKEEEEEEEEGPGGAQGGGKQGVPTDEQDVAAPGFGGGQLPGGLLLAASSEDGGGGGGSAGAPRPHTQSIAARLVASMTQYFRFQRHVQEAEEAGEEPEAWVVDGLRESLMVVRMLRAHVGAVDPAWVTAGMTSTSSEAEHEDDGSTGDEEEEEEEEAEGDEETSAEQGQVGSAGESGGSSSEDSRE